LLKYLRCFNLWAYKWIYCYSLLTIVINLLALTIMGFFSILLSETTIPLERSEMRAWKNSFTHWSGRKSFVEFKNIIGFEVWWSTAVSRLKAQTGEFIKYSQISNSKSYAHFSTQTSNAKVSLLFLLFWTENFMGFQNCI
jgi:hypothetical protein